MAQCAVRGRRKEGRLKGRGRKNEMTDPPFDRLVVHGLGFFYVYLYWFGCGHGYGCNVLAEECM